MLDNVFQPVLHEGDASRISLSAFAIQSAPHRIAKPEPAYLPSISQSMQKPVGGRSFTAKTAKPKFNLFKREGVSSSSN